LFIKCDFCEKNGSFERKMGVLREKWEFCEKMGVLREKWDLEKLRRQFFWRNCGNFLAFFEILERLILCLIFSGIFLAIYIKSVLF
jgi:hypothetical protein